MRNKYQRNQRKSNHKFEVVSEQELKVRVPLATGSWGACLLPSSQTITRKGTLFGSMHRVTVSRSSIKCYCMKT